MKDFDFLDLDARALQVFVTIFETRSVTKASERIGVTQSAVSHTLEKLRKITGNPLFVRSAQGVMPTTEAERMVGEAWELLKGLQRLAKPQPFQPERYDGVFTVGVTDYEQYLFVPQVFRRLRREAPRARLALVKKPNVVGVEDLLRRFDVVFTPYFKAQSGIYRAPLLTDEWFTYFDPRRRETPDALDRFSAADHAVVVLGDHPRTMVDERLAAQGRQRHVSLQVPSFTMLPPLLAGTDLIVTLLGRFRDGLMKDFTAIPCPLPLPRFELNMVWHSRVHNDPAQRWLRLVIEDAVRQV